MNKQRLPQESAFEYKLRLIKAHQSGELDADWNEICALLGNQQNPDHLRKVAKGIMEYDNYLHGQSGVANRILAISDLHVPFQLPIETFSDYAGRIDTLVLNGDIVDMQAISKFPKTYRVSPIEELIQARAYIIELTADGRECVDATFPAVGDKIALVADVVKFYATSTTAKQAEYNYYIPQGQPARAYEVEQYDKFGVSDYMFTTKVGAAVAVGNYVTVDGNGKWKEIVSTSAPDAAATGFIGKVYGFDTGDNEKIVLIETIQNVQIQPAD